MKKIKNKRVNVPMLIDTTMGPRTVLGTAIITNDETGKTLILCYGSRQMTVAFEQIEKYLN